VRQKKPPRELVAEFLLASRAWPGSTRPTSCTVSEEQAVGQLMRNKESLSMPEQICVKD
jgi:hypothetical protein